MLKVNVGEKKDLKTFAGYSNLSYETKEAERFILSKTATVILVRQTLVKTMLDTCTAHLCP